MFFFTHRLSGTASHLRARRIDPAAAVLSSEDFERFLQRERSLADRGTRLFTLMILQRRRGDRAGIEKLSLELRKRLRSTDLLGRLDADGLQILLTDTDPAGAPVVADWIDRA